MAVPYVFVCAGCGSFGMSERSDALTCTNACRMRAMRNGNLKRLRAEAKANHIFLANISQAEAIRLLCPGLEEEIMAGKHRPKDPRVTWSEETREKVWRAFLKVH